MPATKKPDVQRYSFGTQRPDRDEHGEWASAAEHARVCAQRDELVAVLANLADDYEAWMHSEYDGQTTTWQPTSVLIAARNALEKAKE
jgi:hypothetical protein